ncbi:MAG: DUF2236 domain-containing protein [Myxococcales bacterium]|nr:DUF2236 domain-containing protein [Myxococcales bacterium]
MLTDDRLDDLRQQGDASLDPLIAGVMKTDKLKEINAALSFARDNAALGTLASGASLTPELAAWVDEHAQLPEWVDLARVERAQRFFVDRGVTLTFLLGLTSLLERFARPNAARALHAVAKLADAESSTRRLGRATQFFLAILTPDAFTPEGAALLRCSGRRLLRAGQRFLLLDSGWDQQQDGAPFSQLDLLADLMAFAHSPLTYLPVVGGAASDSEAEDWIYLWRVAGVLLGIEPDDLPSTREQAADLHAGIARRARESCPEGRELASSLLEAYAAQLPRPFRGVVPAMTRHLLGEDLAALLGVESSGWKLALSGQRLLASTFQALQKRSTRVNDVVNKLGISMLRHQALDLTGGRAAVIEIPAKLRRAWRLPPAGSPEQVVKVVPDLVNSLRKRLGEDWNPDTLDIITDLLVVVAAADGEIDDLEQAALGAALSTLVGESLDDDQARARVDAARERIEASGIETVTDGLAEALASSHAVEPGIRLATAIAYVNSGIDKAERRIVDLLASRGELSAEALDRIVQEVRDAIEAK